MAAEKFYTLKSDAADFVLASGELVPKGEKFTAPAHQGERYLSGGRCEKLGEFTVDGDAPKPKPAAKKKATSKGKAAD